MPTSAYWEHLTRSAILETELSKHYSLALFSFSDPYTCPILLLPTHQRQVLTVCLLNQCYSKCVQKQWLHMEDHGDGEWKTGYVAEFVYS